MVRTTTFEERFAPPDENGCRVWTKSCDTSGYGHVRFQGRLQSTHRVVWIKAHGPIPEDVCVLHHCDNPPCGELTHLFLGSQLDNIEDRHNKGRTSRASRNRGSRNPVVRLTEEQVREIRTSSESGCALARRLGVHPMTVSDVRRRKTWEWLI